MGIQGLLKVVAPIMDEGHVRDFVGKRVGIDSFSWLHKGAFACAYELAMGIPTDKYIKYCLNRCLMMKSHRVTPVMIFDGCDMPGKKGTNEERARSRRTHMALGQNLVQQERRGEATPYFQRAITITQEMAHKLQLALKQEQIEFVVAPYEADVQLAYMSQQGLIDCVVTEDSDLICYGAKRILFKMDHLGQGALYSHSNLGAVRDPDLANFTEPMIQVRQRERLLTEILLRRVHAVEAPEMLTERPAAIPAQHMCILAGCDFLPSMPGMGIKKAAALLRKHKHMDRVFSAIRLSQSFEIPAGLSPLPTGALVCKTISFTCHT
jgi:exonuclease-1|eukprot:COSAG01_NODE_7269_length_3275_cov_79.494961_1_plen_323_part_00